MASPHLPLLTLGSPRCFRIPGVPDSPLIDPLKATPTTAIRALSSLPNAQQPGPELSSAQPPAPESAAGGSGHPTTSTQHPSPPSTADGSPVNAFKMLSDATPRAVIRALTKAPGPLGQGDLDSQHAPNFNFVSNPLFTEALTPLGDANPDFSDDSPTAAAPLQPNFYDNPMYNDRCGTEHAWQKLDSWLLYLLSLLWCHGS